MPLESIYWPTVQTLVITRSGAAGDGAAPGTELMLLNMQSKNEFSLLIYPFAIYILTNLYILKSITNMESVI